MALIAIQSFRALVRRENPLLYVVSLSLRSPTVIHHPTADAHPLSCVR